MKHQNKQLMAWTVAIGLSGGIYGGGSYYLRSRVNPLSNHAEASNHHEDEHKQTQHQAEAPHDNHKSDHAPEASHSSSGHSPSNSSTDHDSHSADNSHNASHAANSEHFNSSEHGDGHASKEAHSSHAKESNSSHEAISSDIGHNTHATGGDHDNKNAHQAPSGGEHVVSRENAHSSDHEKPNHNDSKSSHGAAHWSYDKKDAAGPNHWGDLAENFAQCKNGQQQSPIDLRGEIFGSQAPKLIWHYEPSHFGIENNGHTIQTSVKSGSNTLSINGEVYSLAQFHFHNPSEHKINGTPSDLELHFVHKNAKGNLAVVGVMINERQGKENPNFKSIWDRLPRSKESNKNDEFNFDATSLLPKGRDFFHYGGSLTTPPCSEGVKWFVLKEPMSMSSGQVEMYSSIFGGPTNRPVQPLQGREIISNNSDSLAH